MHRVFIAQVITEVVLRGGHIGCPVCVSAILFNPSTGIITDYIQSAKNINTY